MSLEAILGGTIAGVLSAFIWFLRTKGYEKWENRNLHKDLEGIYQQKPKFPSDIICPNIKAKRGDGRIFSIKSMEGELICLDPPF